MARPRFFVEGVHAVGDTVQLTGGDAHKILDVLRKRSGDEVEIIDSANRFIASLTLHDRAASALLQNRQRATEEPAIEVTIAQALPKSQKMDFVVEKATELGAAAIIPVVTERAIASGPSGSRLERWRRLARTAALQCGRDRIPDVRDVQSFHEVVASFSKYDLVLFPWELADGVALRDALPSAMKDARTILVLIGPEGGFSHEEAESAQRAGARTISLGSRILRTETAALVVLALVNYVAGV